MPVRPREAPVGILRRCCSRGHVRLRAPYGLTRCILMVWLNNSQDSTGTPCDARTGIVRAPHGNLRFFFISYGTRKVPVRDPQGCRTAPLRTRKGIDTTIIGKNPARASYLAVRAPYGPRTGCSQSQNPYGVRKLIMHALKLYGPCTGRQNSYGAARGSCGPRMWTCDFCSKQPGNSPYGARLCDVTEALSMLGLELIHVSKNPRCRPLVSSLILFLSKMTFYQIFFMATLYLFDFRSRDPMNHLVQLGTKGINSDV